ncbi:MAG: hypothetical protein M0Z49_16660 [Chloroflexi bacterium]|nr:hypothetical protein [Chloroflexota bacterium]
MPSWWARKVRQFATHLHARVTPEERRELTAWLTPDQQYLFEAMHPADRRHGLDVVRRLRSEGWTDRDVLLAGLFHDSGKGRVGLWPRVAWALGDRYGRLPRAAATVLPGFRAALRTLDRHPEASAELALRAGCTPRAADLIRRQEAPADAAGEALHRADEAS